MQDKIASLPRNQLVLQRAALIGRPFCVCRKAQDTGQIAVEVDFQLAFGVRGQRDPVDERAQDVRGFSPVLFGGEDGGKARDLRPVVRRHAGMQHYGFFLGAGEHRFQFLPPRRDPGEIVLDLGSRHAVLDRLNDILARPRKLAEFGFCRRERRVLLAAPLVQVARVFLAEFFHQRGVHQPRFQSGDHPPFQIVLPDDKPIGAGALVARRRAAVMALRDLAESTATAAALEQVREQHAGALLLMEGGQLAQHALPFLHPVPQILIDDAQLRHVLDDQG